MNPQTPLFRTNLAASNVLLALTDREQEGVFTWDNGPENGTVVRTGGTNVPGKFNAWCSGEPNNFGAGEDYVVTNWCVDKTRQDALIAVQYLKP